MKKLQTTHNLGKIRIREYWDNDFEYGDPKGTYFTATIDGWRGFKFFSSNLKPQPFFEKVKIYCNNVLKELENYGEDILNIYPNKIFIE